MLSSGVNPIFAPNASRTSAAPLFEDTLLFPCFATFAPAAAMTNADVVEILKLFARSPPVPTISIASVSSGTIAALALITLANPVISSGVS